jgi:5'-deoxynucleotidase YfbR-like HD superfamily hydrolase
MLSGRVLDLLDPSPFDIEIDDIAHGLARVARWNGQTTGEHPFSVAQHSLVVLDILAVTAPGLDAKAKLMALLHDAPEYVIGDMISPFKAALGLDYRAFEDRLAAAIHQRFTLPAHPAPALKAQIKDVQGGSLVVSISPWNSSPSKTKKSLATTSLVNSKPQASMWWS